MITNSPHLHYLGRCPYRGMCWCWCSGWWSPGGTRVRGAWPPGRCAGCCSSLTPPARDRGRSPGSCCSCSRRSRCWGCSGGGTRAGWCWAYRLGAGMQRRWWWRRRWGRWRKRQMSRWEYWSGRRAGSPRPVLVLCAGGHSAKIILSKPRRYRVPIHGGNCSLYGTGIGIPVRKSCKRKVKWSGLQNVWI